MWLPDNYAILPVAPHAHGGLVIKRTLLKKGKIQLPFLGLFASTNLPANTFLGFYSGVFYEEVWEEDDVEDPACLPPKSDYSVNLSGFTVIPPNKVNPSTHPMAMINEPPKGTTANVAVVEWSQAKDAIPGLPPKTNIYCAAMTTCREISAGEELYYYYGDYYDRTHYGPKPHNVGKGCKPLARNKIPKEQRPRQVLEARGVIPKNDTYIVVE